MRARDRTERALAELSVREAAALVGERATEAVRYVDALLERVEETRPLGGLISLQADELRAVAAAQVGRGIRPAPLAGVPLVVKDNVDVAGTATTAGSLALDGAVAGRDAALVGRLRGAGALVLGKANMHELALGITSNNAAFGPARNPADPSRIPGGSSGGTAVLVASRAAPAGIGTDTGGSIRIPAALCGIVGFRPSVGRWPTQGIVPISPTMDTPGPMARTVADCALLDSVVTGEARDLDEVPLSALRIGVPRPLFWSDLDPEMRSAAEDVLALLDRHGVTLVECEAFEVEELAAGSVDVALFELVPAVRAYFESHGLRFEPAEFLSLIRSADVRAFVEPLLVGPPADAAVYDRAVGVLRPKLRRVYAECFSRNRLDAIVFPTTPLAAVPIGQDETVELNGRQVPTFSTFIRNTAPSAFAGLPGISLPMRRTNAALPQGIELDGPAGSDRRLLAVAGAVEAVLAGHPSGGTRLAFGRVTG